MLVIIMLPRIDTKEKAWGGFPGCVGSVEGGVEGCGCGLRVDGMDSMRIDS